MSITMYDAVVISNIPSNAQAVAGYVGGNFPTYSSLVARFPKAHHLSIAVNASEDAECLDIENGDAAPGDAPGWYKRQKARGVAQPVFYANTSTMPSVIAALTSAGIPRSAYRLWAAHYTFVEHQEPGADATQWTDNALGLNLDQSLCVDNFFGDPPHPPVVNPPHYDWFYKGPFNTTHYKDLNEQKLVEQYDGARKKPILYALYLKLYLRPRLKDLADRVAYVSLYDPVTNWKRPKPDWAANRRGWRYQQLIHRAQGQRFV